MSHVLYESFFQIFPSEWMDHAVSLTSFSMKMNETKICPKCRLKWKHKRRDSSNSIKEGCISSLVVMWPGYSVLHIKTEGRGSGRVCLLSVLSGLTIFHINEMHTPLIFKKMIDRRHAKSACKYHVGFNVMNHVSHCSSSCLFKYSVHQALGMAFCESYWVINLST